MIRKTLGLIVAALLAAAAGHGAGQMVSFQSGAEMASGYLATPSAVAGKKPGIVVIQEWWGVDDFVKKKADWFASQRYVALAPDLYRGQVTKDPDQAHQLMMGLDPDRALADLKAAVAYLRTRPDVDASKIGAVGWCMGGGYALQLALAEPKLAGAVIYYGRLVTDQKQIGSLQVPLLGSFGEKDQGPPPEMVREFEKKAKAAGKSVDFKIYPGAGHAFASSKDPKTFKPDAAADADKRTDAFLERMLKKRS